VNPRADQLRISRLRAVRGPNFWRLAPVIACDLSLGALEEVRSATSPASTTGWSPCSPRCTSTPAPAAATGGFVERLREGTHLPHILEHVALELQTWPAPTSASAGWSSRATRASGG
jgi:cyanophycin synthetase